jgi:hypothetical protein
VVSLGAFGQTTPPPTDGNGNGTTTLTADLSAQNLVPPLADRAESGTARVEITMIPSSSTSSASAVVDFEITLENGQSDAFTGFSINEGAVGLNGPEVVQTVITPDPDEPAGDTITGQITVSSQTQLDGLADLIADPEGFYVVLTGTDAPAGLVRGQLQAEDVGDGMDNLSDKLDGMQDQLDVIQNMIRTIGRSLGIDPAFLPEPDTSDNGGGTDDGGETGDDGGTSNGGGTTNGGTTTGGTTGSN